MRTNIIDLGPGIVQGEGTAGLARANLGSSPVILYGSPEHYKG